MKRIETRKVNLDYLLLFAIVLLGTLLRFYNYLEIPYTHDELSALIRLDYSSFSDLIEKGVKVDGHPAGIQVFLFYWVKLFGDKEYIVKQPFILWGIGSIILAFYLAKKWFGTTTGLLVSAFIATLQFPITYSQMARPYAPGLFFVLIMVFFWSNYFLDDKKSPGKNLVGYIFASAACCYIHYFSMLFSGIVGITGLFLLTKKNYKGYLLALMSIALLFIPHLQIFFHQLGNAGLEWLSKPNPLFIVEHIKYIVHYSPLCFTLALLIPASSIIAHKTITINRLQTISAIWFLSPILIGIVYSILAKPVLQHSVLLFSLPFMFIFLFSFCSTNNRLFKIIAVSLVMLVNIYTLTITRKHYEVFYKQPFKEFATQSQSFLSLHKDSTTIMLAGNPKYINFYFKQYNPGAKYLVFQDNFASPSALRAFLAKNSSEYLICGNIPLQYLPIIQEFYPYTYSYKHGFTFDYFVLSKLQDNCNAEKEVYYTNSLAKNNASPLWSNNNSSLKISEGSTIYQLDSLEWGPSFTTTLTDIAPSRHAIIYIKAEVKAISKTALVVCDIKKNGKTVSWHSSRVKDYYYSTSNWQSVYLAIRLTDIFRNPSAMRGCKISVFLWNNEQNQLSIKDMCITVQEGNNRIYGLFEDID